MSERLKVVVSLSRDEADALLKMSQIDTRHPRDELRHFFRQVAVQRGMLPPPDPQTQPDRRAEEGQP